MDILIRLALWNANGVTQMRNELSLFVSENQVDVVIQMETRLANNHIITFPDGLQN